jgi:hypothetical protein
MIRKWYLVYGRRLASVTDVANAFGRLPARLEALREP